MNSKVGLGGFGKASNAIKALKNNNNTLVNVSLDLIDFDEDQYRKDKERYKLVSLATSIRNNGGLIQNPNYEKQENGRYLVLTGEMRTRAYMYLKENYPDEPEWREIPVRIRTVKIIDGLSLKASRKIFQFTENDQGEKPNLFDRAQGLLEIFDEGGTDAVQIALSEDDLKSSAAEVSKWKSLAKVNNSIRSEILDHEIEDKETIITLGKIADKSPDKYKDLMDSFKDKSLDVSLAKATRRSWDIIKESKGKKVSKAKGKHKNKSELGSKQKVTSEKSNEEGIMEMIASNITFKDGRLVVLTKNGMEMKFVGLDHLDIAISEKSKKVKS